MTVFLWDTSHYDDGDGLDLATMKQAKAEGIVGVTAKAGEAARYDDPADAGTLTAARDAGILVLGAYYVPRTPAMVGVSPKDQARHWLSLLNSDVPWWRDFGCWFNQTDLELWPYDPVPASVGIEVGNWISDFTDRETVLYASHGQYGDKLRAWTGKLWNANYPSSRQAPFKDLYPGDNGVGWQPYSGQTPVFWQYASSATIAGKTTSDANAFRGTVDELIALLGGNAVTYPTAAQIAVECEDKTWHTAGSTGNKDKDGKSISAGTAVGASYDRLIRVEDRVEEVDGKLDEVLTLLRGFTGGPVPVTGTVSLQAQTTPPTT